ncbi:lysine 2,3-aminomutase [Streptomyces sp. 11x1]|uniref:KamA family radical SAM protein n=1 Tax=Streptomyces sp. 11x1 TaxID=3038642 RepID=UPI002931F3B3|nr:lysine 2,3-aminomutase [Streptomyces sp. 11x1]WNZ06268.1 lysine 2,3-aminomutase [Streptomyces sp. 11x1]
MPFTPPAAMETERFRAYGARHVDELSARFGIPQPIARSMKALAAVLPFRVNEYVLANLVDWDNIPGDPIFQMVFPQSGMLPAEDERRLAELVDDPAAKKELRLAVQQIRGSLNPHPSGQKQLNVPTEDGQEVPGLQHKYRETVLYFPGQGQTCHAYCTYCFRWAQFVGDADLRFAVPEPSRLIDYLGRHPEVDDVLVTGGDPMIMSTDRLRSHLEPLLDVTTVRTIRIGTKSVAYWPQRFVTDSDADDVLRLFEKVVASGRNLAVMMHFTHPRELESDIARRAVERIRATGALAYCQAPLVAHVNDDPDTWSATWRAELAAGAVPYYMFVERDTGPYEYFKVPLARAHDIFRSAYLTLPGLARTVRGPVMSATPGKVVVDGVTETPDGRYFQLRMLQARDPRLVGRPFRAHYSETAAWLDDLRLADDTPADIAAAIGGTLPAVTDAIESASWLSPELARA